MGYIEGQDRNQIILFPESIDDYISEDNPVSVIDEYVEQHENDCRTPIWNCKAELGCLLLFD